MRILQQKMRQRIGKVKNLKDLVSTLKDKGIFDILVEN